jgi:hypothetical protein
MSDYEATAYLSLEKLKVSIINFTLLGEAYARILVIPGQNSERALSEDEVFKGPARVERQGG